MSDYFCVNENVYANAVDNDIDLNTNPLFVIAECGCTSGQGFGNASCIRYSNNIECDV